MAFKIVNNEVITDGLDGQLDNLIVDGVNVLAGDGSGNVTLQNVIIDAGSIDTSSLTTDDIAEGSNLYYTDVRVQNYLTANSYATEGYADQSELDAITTSNLYTDTREIAITGAYQAYTDQSELDAIASAQAYTDVEISSLTSYVDAQDVSTLSSAQAYTDAVIAGGFDSTDYIGFDTAVSVPSHAEGRLFYDASVNALSYYNDNSDVTVNIGREVLVKVKNITGSPITNGSAVFIDSADTDIPTISLSQADTIATAIVDGIVTHDIDDGEVGYMTQLGTVRDVATSMYSAGQRLYLSDALAGGWSIIAPSFPSYTVEIGVVTISDAASGEIEINIHSHALETLQVHGQADFEDGLNSHLDIDMLNNNIVNVADPINAQDAATRSYVDTAISNVSGDVSALTTDDVTEGTTNLYYTDSRARASISVSGSGSYTPATGVIDIQGGVTSVNAQTGDVVLSTTDVTEGTNLYYTDTRANSAIDTRVDTSFVNALNVTAAGVQSNSVTLGTDTTGSYVQTISGTASEIVITGGTGESSTPVISLPTNMVIPQDLTITGDLTVQGTTIINDTNTVEVADPYVTVGGINGLQFDDNKDRGVRFKWHDGTADVTAGSFVVGQSYVITSIGTTDFTAIGAASNTVGEDFTATGSGSGTGTANNLANTHVGFFGFDDSTQCFTYIPDATETGGVFSGTKGCIDVESVTATTFTGDLVGNADTATTLATPRTITLYGDVSGTTVFDGSSNVTIEAVVANNSHLHGISDITGLQSALDDKLSSGHDITLTILGDVTGAVTFTDMSSASLTATVTDNSHNHVSSNISDLTESVQDIVGAMVSPVNTENGIAVFYDDTAGKLNFDVNDTVIALSGDVSGSAIMTNLGNVTITTTVANDSHTHDGRYYTEAESDARFVNVAGDTLTGTLTLSGTPINDLHAATKKYVDDTVSVNVQSIQQELDTTQSSAGLGAGGLYIPNAVANYISTATSLSAADSLLDFALKLEEQARENLSDDLFAAVDTKLGVSENAISASKWQIGRTLSLTGDVSGSIVIDGSSDVSISTTISDDSHTHDIRYYTKSQADSRYAGLGGAAFTGTVYAPTFIGSLTGNASTATTSNQAISLQTARTFYLTGDVTGSATFDGSGDATITATVVDGSHNHSIANVTGLQAELNSKLDLAGGSMSGPINMGTNNTVYISGSGAETTGSWIRNKTAHGYIDIGPANTSYAHVYSGNPGFYFNQSIFSVGDITAYASDKRLKENVESIDNALDKVLSLTGMTYTWNSTANGLAGYDMNTRHAGVFAQDVQAVLPEAVSPAPFDIPNGISESGEDYLTVKYEKLVPLLIEAMKEQQSQIEALKSEIQELKDK